jgi:hypothetical protein
VSSTFGHPKLSVTGNFGLVEPKYNVTTETGLSNLIHYLTPGVQPFSLVSSSDAAAIWGGQADFAIKTPTSATYVAPTKSTMQAAVSDMAPQADGTLVPDPRGGPVNGSQPYPLTYVEYAIVPTQPLMTATCAPRSQSQQDLTAWLNYITGVGQTNGQTNLPAGMAPLTSALQAQAQAAIAKVGQAAPACGVTTVSTTRTTSATSSGSGSGSAGTAGGSGTGSTPTAQGANSGSGSTASSSGTGTNGQSSGSGSSASSGRFSSSNGSSGSTTNSGAGGGTTSSTPGATKPKGSSALNPGSALAGFTAAEGTNWLLPAGGMLLLFLLLPGLVLLAAGRSPPQALAKVGRWLRWGNRQPPVGPS